MSLALASNSGVTYQGRILKPDGSPLSGQFTQFKMQIRTPDSQNCLLYEEVQSQDLRNSNGVFSITINDGSGSRTDTTGLTLERIFANRGTFSGLTGCTSGGSYMPNSSDGRDLVVLFKDETMTIWEPVPAQKINFVPFAFESKQVQGFSVDSLLRVVNGAGDPITGLAPLSNSQYATLLDLVNGASTTYSKPNELNGVALPTMSSGEVLGWNGSAWVSQSTVGGANSVATAMIQSGAVDSTKIATGAVSTTQIASNVSISTSGTLASAVTTTHDFKIYAASPSTSYVGMAAPALTSSYTLTWPMNAGSNGEVLTTDGGGGLTWTTPTPASTAFVRGGNSFNANADLGTNDAYGLNLRTAGSTRMTVTSIGNVGIGTAAPLSKLDINGGGLHIQNGSAYGALLNDTSSGDFYLSTGGAPRIYVKSSGRVGIGHAAPPGFFAVAPTQYSTGSALQSGTTITGTGTSWTSALVGSEFVFSNGTSAGTILSVAGANSLTVSTSQVSAGPYKILYAGLQVDGSGNVGIGTTAPKAKLDVSGQIRSSMGAPLTDPPSAGVDFVTGNTQYVTFTACSGNAKTVNLYSMFEGGSYSLVVVAPMNCLVTFTGTDAAIGAGGGAAITSFEYSGGVKYASTGNPMVFSFLRANNLGFTSQVVDFQN